MKKLIILILCLVWIGALVYLINMYIESDKAIAEEAQKKEEESRPQRVIAIKGSEDIFKAPESSIDLIKKKDGK